ncbi:MAG: hypothetical protein KAT05_00160 [Spirochaetes bacterium]|nr:hypothetical protein [Spirochaetota bacterium]
MRNKILIIFLSILLIGCINSKKQVKEEKDDFDLWLVKAQEYTNKEKYMKAIDLLNEAMIKFSDTEVLTINYNIGFNYYKLKKYGEAKRYLNRVTNLFETAGYSQVQISEYRKFVILSNILLEKIDENKKNIKDPYHIKEEMKDKKKIRAKKE